MTTPAIEARLPVLDEATERLLATIESLTDDELRAPSRLEGWSRAHVVAHLAGNASAMTRMATWAATGVETPAYASREARDAEIEQLAALPAAELKAELRTRSQGFRDALSVIAGPAGQRSLKGPGGRRLTAVDLPRARTREVKIHHVDLDAGVTTDDWSATFAAETLDDLTYRIRNSGTDPGISNLRATDSLGTWVLGPSGVELRGGVRSLLAWLSGRSDGQDLQSEPAGEVPAPPPWG